MSWVARKACKPPTTTTWNNSSSFKKERNGSTKSNRMLFLGWKRRSFCCQKSADDTTTDLFEFKMTDTNRWHHSPFTFLLSTTCCTPFMIAAAWLSTIIIAFLVSDNTEFERGWLSSGVGGVEHRRMYVSNDDGSCRRRRIEGWPSTSSIIGCFRMPSLPSLSWPFWRHVCDGARKRLSIVRLENSRIHSTAPTPLTLAHVALFVVEPTG